jgi:hypothetical protein
MSELISSRDVVIRKPCRCSGCARTMQPGTPMNKATYRDGSEFGASAWCLVCQAYLDRHMDTHDEIGIGELKSEDPETWEAIRKELEAA